MNGAGGLLCSASPLQEPQYHHESSHAPLAPACPKQVAGVALGVQGAWDWCRMDGVCGQSPATVPLEPGLRRWVLVEVQIQSLSLALWLIWA